VRGCLTRSGRGGLHRDVEIEIAVVVVVDKSEADATFFPANADFFCDVVEFSIGEIVEETDAVREADGEIGVTVIIEIACGAAVTCRGALEACSLRNVGEFSVTQIVEEMTCCDFSATNNYIRFVVAGIMEDKAICAGLAADEEKIGFTVAVVIKEASTITRTDGSSGSRHSARGTDRLSDEGR